MLGLVALDERYGLREYGDVAAQNAVDILIGGERASAFAHEVGVDYRLFGHAFGDVQRAVVMRVGILFLVMIYFRK